MGRWGWWGRRWGQRRWGWRRWGRRWGWWRWRWRCPNIYTIGLHGHDTAPNSGYGRSRAAPCTACRTRSTCGCGCRGGDESCNIDTNVNIILNTLIILNILNIKRIKQNYIPLAAVTVAVTAAAAMEVTATATGTAPSPNEANQAPNQTEAPPNHRTMWGIVVASLPRR